MVPAASLRLTPDLASLSLFRIAFATYLLVDWAANLRPDFDAFFGPAGLLPLDAWPAPHRTPGLFDLLAGAERIGLPRLLPVLYPAALVALLAGWRTRPATLVAFALNTWLHWRNPVIKSGAEDLGNLLLLWCCFLPLDRHASIDAALDPQHRDRATPLIPLLAVRLQIASLYLFSGLYKLAGMPWLDGNALSLILGDTVFADASAAPWLLRHAPFLLPWINWAVIGFQLSFPFLVYCPWRNDRTRAIALAGAAAMHLAFIVCLNVGGFPYLCFAMLLLLLPDAWLDRLRAGRRAQLAGTAIFHEAGCGFCRRVALLLRELLLPAGTPVLPATADPVAAELLARHNSWVVRGPDGRLWLKWRALAWMLRQSPLLAPLGWLTDLRPLRPGFARLYDTIGRQRRWLGPVTRLLLPERAVLPLPRPAQALCAALMLMALASNVVSLRRAADPEDDPRRPDRFAMLADLLQVNQRWSLFAPIPTHWDWRYRVDLVGPDDSRQPIDRALADPPLRLGPDGRPGFRSHRWLKYWTRLEGLTPAEWHALGVYLCRASAAAGVPAKRIEIALDMIPVPGADAARRRVARRLGCAP